MTQSGSSHASGATRREFLKASAAVAGAAALGEALLSARAYAAGSDVIPIALVGCGGRGTGAAAQALSTTSGPTKLVAMADVFEDRQKSSLAGIKNQFKASPEKVDVTPERTFLGFDAAKHAIDAVGVGGLVILATPPAFRPRHLELAVEKGCHVFMEKSFAVDGPGIRRVMAAGEAARKRNLKIAGGLMSRHYPPLEEAVRRIHEGAIGDVITAWAYREHGPVGFSPRRPGESEFAHQIRNYSCFTWVNGSFLLDWLIHNLDVCCWVKDAWPVACQGQGGRELRTLPDQLFDHYAAEYTFPDGTRLFAQGRHMDGCFDFFGDVIHGTTGCAVLGEGITTPRLYKGWKQAKENVIWEHTAPGFNHYQIEHDLLFAAIREDKPYNETDRCAKAALTGILGRMAVESGKLVTWEQALASNVELAPGLDSMTLDSAAPVTPDAKGQYPVAKPGVSKTV